MKLILEMRYDNRPKDESWYLEFLQGDRVDFTSSITDDDAEMFPLGFTEFEVNKQNVSVFMDANSMKNVTFEGEVKIVSAVTTHKSIEPLNQINFAILPGGRATFQQLGQTFTFAAE